MIWRISMAVLAILATLAVSGCPKEVTGSLALGGAKKYTADVLSCTSNIKAEVEAGEVSAATVKKFDDVLAKWEPEMTGKGTFIQATKIQGFLHKAQENPADAFRNNQMAANEIAQLIDYFKTEVPD